MNTPLCMLVSAMLRSRRPILSTPHDSGLLNLCQVATVKVFRQVERNCGAVRLRFPPAPESTAISPFNFEGKGVRVVVDDDVEWFVAKDLALAVGHSTYNTHLIDKVPTEWKGVKPIHTPGGAQSMAVLTEEGVNSS